MTIAVDWDLKHQTKHNKTGLSLTGGTVLFPLARHFILCLVLVQLRKCPDMIENVDREWDVKQQFEIK